MWTSKGRKKKLSDPNYTNKLSLRRGRRLRKKIPSITTKRGKRKKLVLPVVVLPADLWWQASEGRTLFFIFVGWRRWNRWVVGEEDRQWFGFWFQNYIGESIWFVKEEYIYLIKKRNKSNLKIKSLWHFFFFVLILFFRFIIIFLILCWREKLWELQKFRFYIITSHKPVLCTGTYLFVW